MDRRTVSVKTSIIIPTYNREEDLTRAIRSILDQDLLPDELVIVDDGDLSDIPLRDECEKAGIRCIYFQKDTPGLTASRNAGIRLSGGDILLFFDDDVELFPEHLQALVSVYEADTDKLTGAVGGVIVLTTPMTWKNYVRFFLEVIFLQSGFRAGMILPSGFCTDYEMTPFPVRTVREADFLNGCAMSFRKEVFNEFSFDEELFLRYGLGEDKELTHSVSRKYRLIVTPKAKLYHHKSPAMRINSFRDGYMHMMFNYLFFTTHAKKGWWSWPLFGYALFGYILIRILSFVVYPRKDKLSLLKGIFSALGDIMKGERRVA